MIDTIKGHRRLQEHKNMVETFLEELRSAQHSGYRPIASGVPQGSVLGPIPFGLFSSDLPRVLTHCECRKYADDIQIYYHALPSKLNDALGLVERDAQAVADWAWNNGLELNTKKTQVIILGSAHYTSSIDLTRLRKICMNNMPLSLTTEVKNLGVKMNQTLERTSMWPKCKAKYTGL